MKIFKNKAEVKAPSEWDLKIEVWRKTLETAQKAYLDTIKSYIQTKEYQEGLIKLCTEKLSELESND